LVIADQDGYNPRTIVSADDVLMSPTWSPDARRLAFVAIREGRSEIYIYDLGSGSKRRISSQPGINGAPAWSPDGRFLVATLSFSGNPEIYVIDAGSGERRRITDSRGIDTEASWTPDGQSVIFTSDRGGRPQIYRVSKSGGEPKRLTFEGKSNQRGTLSPDGKLLAMVHEDENGYRIAVQDLASGSLRVISRGPLDESPGFAPNGQVLIYSRSAGRGAELATVSVDGRIKRRLHQQGTVREPAWSPIEN
jgi:TolB protein